MTRVYCHRNVIMLDADGPFRSRLRLMATDLCLLSAGQLRELIAAAASEYDRITATADAEEVPRCHDGEYVASLRSLSASLALRAGEAHRRGHPHLARDLAEAAKRAASQAEQLETEAADVA